MIATGCGAIIAFKSDPAAVRVLQKAEFSVDPGLSEAGTDMYVRTIKVNR